MTLLVGGIIVGAIVQGAWAISNTRRIRKRDEALKAARLYIAGEALPTKIKVIEMIDAALSG